MSWLSIMLKNPQKTDIFAQVFGTTVGKCEGIYGQKEEKGALLIIWQESNVSRVPVTGRWQPTFPMSPRRTADPV